MKIQKKLIIAIAGVVLAFPLTFVGNNNAQASKAYTRIPTSLRGTWKSKSAKYSFVYKINATALSEDAGSGWQNYSTKKAASNKYGIRLYKLSNGYWRIKAGKNNGLWTFRATNLHGKKVIESLKPGKNTNPLYLYSYKFRL